MDLFQTIQDFHQAQASNASYVIAFSGGVDSHVLLHLFANLRTIYPIQLKAIHINHSLSPNADYWTRHCEKICAELAVDFYTETIQAKPKAGESPEAAARRGRYGVFEKFLNARDILVTAHHQDDQAETVMLQLLRGAGPKGLAGMPKMKVFHHAQLARPLLSHARAEIEKYAEENHLSWITDESNANTHYTRNYIRHDLLPLIAERWPSVGKTLARTAQHCAEMQMLLEEMAEEDLQRVWHPEAQTLSVSKLLSLTPARQRQVLRLWLETLNYPMPSTAKLFQIQTDMLGAKIDKTPCVAWAHVELRRYQDVLYAMPALVPHDAHLSYTWDWRQPLILPEVGVLQTVERQGSGLNPDIAPVLVKYRDQGETCRLPGRECHHSLKKLLQTWQVPTWERARLPLIYAGERLIAIPGYFMDEAYTVGEDAWGLEVFLEKNKAD